LQAPYYSQVTNHNATCSDLLQVLVWSLLIIWKYNLLVFYCVGIQSNFNTKNTNPFVSFCRNNTTWNISTIIIETQVEWSSHQKTRIRHDFWIFLALFCVRIWIFFFVRIIMLLMLKVILLKQFFVAFFLLGWACFVLLLWQLGFCYISLCCNCFLLSARFSCASCTRSLLINLLILKKNLKNLKLETHKMTCLQFSFDEMYNIDLSNITLLSL